MLKIKEEDLQLYLSKRKQLIEFKKFSGIPEIISGISMLITLICCEFNLIFLYYIGIISSVIILLLGIVEFIISLRNYFTIDLCYKEIFNLDDSNRRTQYIVVIKDFNMEGKFLLIYNSMWKCYLFPSYDSTRILNSNISEIDSLKKVVKENFNLQTDIFVEKIGELEDQKLNIGEKCYMKYKFKFYLVRNNQLIYKKDKLKINGHIFRWMTVDQMYKSNNILKKNMAVVDYINNHTNISKI